MWDTEKLAVETVKDILGEWNVRNDDTVDTANPSAACCLGPALPTRPPTCRSARTFLDREQTGQPVMVNSRTRP